MGAAPRPGDEAADGLGSLTVRSEGPGGSASPRGAARLAPADGLEPAGVRDWSAFTARVPQAFPSRPP